MKENEKISKKIKIFLGTIIFIMLLLSVSFFYVMDYYHANESAADALHSKDEVKVTLIKEGYYFDGKGTESALIFYPGAKVEYTAYAPLMQKIAEQGVDCFLVKMPCNLAFLGKNKADGIIEKYTYEKWYLGGHSLGGAMAASYAAEERVPIAGLVLLAAYPTSQLPESYFDLLTIYGSNDGVLTLEKVEKGKQYWPAQSQELCIEGGNHAWFGNYGEQKGDGKATITREEQQEQTARLIGQWGEN